MSINLPAEYKPRAKNPMNQYELVVLAREIAIGIHDIPTILKRYGLSDAEYDSIKLTAFFIKVLEHETKAWESVLNTEKRTQLKAAAFFEDIMPNIYRRMAGSDEALKDVIEGAKLVAKVAGIGEKDAKAITPGEKFSITINLGEDTKLQFDKSMSPVQPTINTDSAQSIGADHGGPSIQHIIEGA